MPTASSSPHSSAAAPAQASAPYLLDATAPEGVVMELDCGARGKFSSVISAPGSVHTAPLVATSLRMFGGALPRLQCLACTGTKAAQGFALLTQHAVSLGRHGRHVPAHSAQPSLHCSLAAWQPERYPLLCPYCSAIQVCVNYNPCAVAATAETLGVADPCPSSRKILEARYRQAGLREASWELA